MPELPEVETVKNTLKTLVLNKTVESVDVYHNNIIEYPSVSKFKSQIMGETIKDIERRGKWLIFELDNYYLLSHLRMEGKYFLKNNEAEEKHEHVIFKFTDGSQLRYHDTRKFGKMHLIEVDKINCMGPLLSIGLEPWDKSLDEEYLLKCFKNKKAPIKTMLLDQSIIAGVGNIYADEILFLCNIKPTKRSCDITRKQCREIIDNTKNVLEEAIKAGGTTIKSYQSGDGIEGLFQQQLMVHNNEKKECEKCGTIIKKIVVNGRGTYYCLKCQK